MRSKDGRIQTTQEFFQRIAAKFSGTAELAGDRGFYLWLAGLAGLVIYVFGYPFSKDVCYAGEWLMLGVFFLLLPRAWPHIKKDPLLLAWCVLVAYLLFKVAYTCLVFDEPFVETLDAARRRIRFGWILILAWWIGGREAYLRRILAAGFFGYLMLLATGFEASHIKAILDGRRLWFADLHPIHLSLYSATVLTCLVFWAREFRGTKFRRLRTAGWVVSILVCLQMVVSTQTRTVWLALMAMAVFTLAVLFFANRRTGEKVFPVKTAAVLAVLVLLPILYFQKDTVVQKFRQETKTIANLAEMNIKDIPNSSLGMRIHAWTWALDMIAERPVFGWKVVDTTRDLIGEKGEVNSVVRKGFSHIHNSYLEILLNVGLAGFCLYAFFPVYASWRIYRSYRDKCITPRSFLLFCNLLLLFLIANITESYITSWIFWPYVAILFGGFYTIPFWSRAEPAADGATRRMKQGTKF